MIRLDERGKECPIPIIEAKKALENAPVGEICEVIVDNEIAVQNLKKMAEHKGYSFGVQRKSAQEMIVRISVSGEGSQTVQVDSEDAVSYADCKVSMTEDGIRKGMIAVISSGTMGTGDEKLGKTLMKGFIYALTQQDIMPETVLLYNGGAFLSCQGSDSVQDLKTLEEKGVKILTCGTCLNYYDLSEKLEVGTVTNLYEIAEKETAASIIIRP